MTFRGLPGAGTFRINPWYEIDSYAHGYGWTRSEVVLAMLYGEKLAPPRPPWFGQPATPREPVRIGSLAEFDSLFGVGAAEILYDELVYEVALDASYGPCWRCEGMGS